MLRCTVSLADAAAGAAEAPNEEIVQAIVTAIQEEVEHVQVSLLESAF